MNTQDRVIQVIAENQGLEIEDINVDSTMEDIGADSLDVIEIAMAIEEEFEIDITDESIEKFETVQSVIDCVEEIS